MVNLRIEQLVNGIQEKHKRTEGSYDMEKVEMIYDFATEAETPMMFLLEKIAMIVVKVPC